MDPSRPATPPPALLQAVRRILRPLIRICLRHGLTLSMLVEEIKAAYVEVAEQHFGLPDKPVTHSRISLLTGVHRKDVRRLRETPRSPRAAPRATSVGAQLVARWLAQRKYLDRQGRPRRLPLRAPGNRTSFEGLVAEVSGRDLRGRVVLEELVRLGIVSVENDVVELEVEGFVPSAGFEERAYYLGANVGDHLSAAAHNLNDEAPPFFDRSVSYHGLAEKDIAKLRSEATEQGMVILRSLNRRALAMQRRNAGRTGAAGRINFGLYFYSEQEAGGDE